MPRRGRSSMDVPTGWVQVLRGPRPPSQKWPSVPRPSQQRQSQVPRSRGHVRSNRVQPTRVNPDASHEVAREKIAKLEKALGQGPAVEALKAELERTMGAAKRPPINVEADECRKFIQARETHSRVGCGTRRRGSRSQRSEGSPPTVGGRVSTAGRSQCAPSFGSRDLFRSAEVAGIGCPAAIPTCPGCRSNTNDSGHSQFQALDCEKISCPHVSRRCSNGCGTVNKTSQAATMPKSGTECKQNKPRSGLFLACCLLRWVSWSISR